MPAAGMASPISGFFVSSKERSFAVIHQYKNNGYNIVLDVNSGSVHVVDELVYDVIALLEEGKSEQETVEALKDRYPEAELLEVPGAEGSRDSVYRGYLREGDL